MLFLKRDEVIVGVGYNDANLYFHNQDYAS